MTTASILRGIADLLQEMLLNERADDFSHTGCPQSHAQVRTSTATPVNLLSRASPVRNSPQPFSTAAARWRESSGLKPCAADRRSPVADGGGDGEYLHVGSREKRGEVVQQGRGAGFERPNTAFHPHQVADSHLVARGLESSETDGGPRSPNRRLLHIIDDDAGVKKNDHLPDP